MRLFMLLECCKVATQCDEDKEREGKEDNKNKSHARMSVCVNVCVGLVCDSCVRVCLCVCVCVWVLIMASRIKRQHASATLIRLLRAGLWGYLRVKLMVRLV